MRLFGVHTSIKRTLTNAVIEAKELGCTTFQIFLQSPRVWNLNNKRTDEEIKEFKEMLRISGFSKFFVHCSYLISPLSELKEVRKKSLKMLENELKVSDIIGADYYILHLRGRKEFSAVEDLKYLVSLLSELKAPQRTRLLIENMPSGNLTARIEDLEFTTEFLKDSISFYGGICLDSCHLFAAGYNLNEISKYELSEKLRKIKSELRLIHLNDSKFDAGRGTDRHENLGEGKIGIKSLKTIVCLDEFKEVPVILETPKNSLEDDRKNLKILKERILNCS